jgi:diguanylate cyclase (GGDEF)-like protein
MPAALPTSDDPAVLHERALALLIADGEESARLASVVLQAADADAGRQCLSFALLALYELREGEVDAGAAHLAVARECLGSAVPSGTGPSSRAQQFIAHVQAQWHRREGSLAEAQGLLRPLHALADQRSPVDAYLTAASLGSVLSMQGDDDGALDLFYQALAFARRSGEDSLVVNALNNLGSYQSDLYNLEDGRSMLEESLKGALHIGSRRQIIYAAGNLVQCLCLMGYAAQALELAREHLIGRIYLDDLPALHRDEEIAQALLDNGLVAEAEAALGDELHIDTLSNEQATARLCLQARILLHHGHAAQALQLCLPRRALLAQDGETTTGAIDRVDLLRVAAQAASAMSDHALAYTLLEEAWSTYERLLGRATRARRLSLQITHRLRQAEWERDAAHQLAASLASLNTSLQAQVAENERLQLQLRAQALEDPLTGLHNRRHLFDAGGALLSLLRRRGEPLAAAVVDLDHFKQINDRHGHDWGDRVLCAFAELVRRETRAEDIVCRYGGEEFVLLFPGANAARAAARLGELLARFRALRFDGAVPGGFSCSFSAGVSAWRGDDEALEALLARADAALYAAKAGGRDRVHCGV